jgi:MoxR-like ATPase
MLNEFESRVDLSQLREALSQIKQEIRKVIVGQDEMIELLIAAILADGHVLIEGVPGVAKTLTAKLISRAISVQFSRIQFTPDLMPSDVLGTSIYSLKTGEFQFKQGPVFSNIVLIDEINRSPAKTQAALFEVMEERQVTVDGTTHPMAPPFIVLATQNPIEQEGTYRLPEAQLDRFLFKIEVNYPDLEEETQILALAQKRRNQEALAEIQPVLTAQSVEAFRQNIRQIRIEPSLLRYIAQIVHSTRSNASLFLGASPRASLALFNGSKAYAAMAGRDFVTPEDIKFIAPAVLRHRIQLTPEREMEGTEVNTVVKQLVGSIEVPR